MKIWKTLFLKSKGGKKILQPKFLRAVHKKHWCAGSNQCFWVLNKVFQLIIKEREPNIANDPNKV